MIVLDPCWEQPAIRSLTPLRERSRSIGGSTMVTETSATPTKPSSSTIPRHRSRQALPQSLANAARQLLRRQPATIAPGLLSAQLLIQRPTPHKAPSPFIGPSTTATAIPVPPTKQ